MTNPLARVLLVEDSSAYARLVRELLREAPVQYEVVHATRLSEAGGGRRAPRLWTSCCSTSRCRMRAAWRRSSARVPPCPRCRSWC